MQKCLCPRGYSCLQIAILSVLRSPHEVLAYWQIAELVKGVYYLKTSEGAVRGAIERLDKYKMLVKERSVLGHLKGNRYAFKVNPCPHIPLLENMLEAATQAGTESHMQLARNAAPSILDKIDRNNLSILSKAKVDHKQLLEALSEEDIKFHWPNLAAADFGTFQIRQVIERQEQIGNSLEHVLAGLTYAEWELEKGLMRDKSGKPVESPQSWVFICLAKNGYYRRPKGYISPEEQADQDRMEDLQKQKEIREARIKIEFSEWFLYLTPEDKHDILGGECVQEESVLRVHFRKNVWPKIFAETNKEKAE